MEVNAYLQRVKCSMHDELLKSPSPFEMKLCENLFRVEIRGESGRKVPVLFPTSTEQSVELLIKTRDEVGIPPSNPYMFAHPFFGSQENISGCDCLKRYAESCGAHYPENIMSTKLRKHVAIVSQLLNLQTHELDQLVTFMGLDIEVQTKCYIRPEESRQIAMMSAILDALRDGMGQSLEDLTPTINCK